MSGPPSEASAARGDSNGLLGTSTSWASIRGTVAEIGEIEKENQARIDADIKSSTTPEEWAKESFASAKKDAYLDGKLDVANSEDEPSDEDVPNLTADYMKHAGDVARIAVARAGRRLATMLLTVL